MGEDLDGVMDTTKNLFGRHIHASWVGSAAYLNLQVKI